MREQGDVKTWHSPKNAGLDSETVYNKWTIKETVQPPLTERLGMPVDTVPESNDFGTRDTARAGDTLGYARVSTNDQNLEGQRVRLIEAGAIRVFVDVVSGKRFERPGLAKLIDHARPGDRLCVTRLDRLGRSLRELLETVDALKARGIHLVSLEERLDTSSAAGELVFHVFGAIAHFERRLISERTRDGIAAARRRGRTPGRPPLDPDTISAAQKLIDAGLSPGRAAKQLGIGWAEAHRPGGAAGDLAGTWSFEAADRQRLPGGIAAAGRAAATSRPPTAPDGPKAAERFRTTRVNRWRDLAGGSSFKDGQAETPRDTIPPWAGWTPKQPPSIL